MRARWFSSLEGRLISRLVAIHVVALLAGFLALANKRYHFIHGLSDRVAIWSFPLFALGVLAVVIVTIRASLRPVVEASRQASAIEPGRLGSRLDAAAVPTEIVPFVDAVNGALDRLEQAFEMQRRFTADAAHELRTPLTILTAGIEALPPDLNTAKLRDDVGRMARLVEQLLRVARLDAQPAAGERVDLCLIAADLVSQMAPWAFKHGRTLALEIPCSAAIVRGDAEGLSGALRNLIENALHHTPEGTEVTVQVTSDGVLRVRDHGLGIPLDQRERVFQRFWRGPGTSRPGAGLGLAIVAAVAAAHHTDVQIDDAPGGGACFSIRFDLSR